MYVADRVLLVKFDDGKTLKYRFPVYEFKDEQAQQDWQAEADRAVQAKFEQLRDVGMKCASGAVKAVEIVSDRVIKL